MLVDLEVALRLLIFALVLEHHLEIVGRVVFVELGIQLFLLVDALS